jgi:hypothetical protein
MSLVSATGTLLLSPNENHWTTVALSGRAVDQVLGAEMFEYVREHLREFLKSPARELRWILTLSENYHVFYGMAVEDGLLIRIQNREAQFIAEITLSEDERNGWLAILDHH